MKRGTDKQLENLVDTLMKGTTLESPSPDFTSKVMLLATKKSKITDYKPLISWQVFVGVLLCFAAAYFYLNVNSSSQNAMPFYDLYVGSIYNVIPPLFFEFSEITTYTVVFATLVLFLQIYVLNKHFDKQLEKYSTHSGE